MHQTVDSAFVGKRNRVVDDDIPSSLLQEQTGPSSSCVTWNEKTQIVESTGHQYDHDPTAEILTMNFDGISQEKGAVNLINIDRMDFQFDNEDARTSISGQNMKLI
ncbi:hypothetical protein LOK49_LG09G00905 [Camellia lanceoleosa]|uniref:Uncharacterized protein n=1 Tax=Camellia lanceoleosa TaxID=1840588 RepID=A0ACC0GP07_9ERIC|nr:hypothetical protein LOK49_LG09G00905 [Camellia lanceoleosa]